MSLSAGELHAVVPGAQAAARNMEKAGETRPFLLHLSLPSDLADKAPVTALAAQSATTPKNKKA
jgi:hypothetical protein